METASQARHAMDQFALAHPDEAAWIQKTAPTFNFAADLREAVTRFGYLTEKQLAAVRKCIERAKAEEGGRLARREGKTVTIEKIEQAFAAAKARGIQRPKMRLDVFMFKPAGARTTNPGAVYVTLKDNASDVDGQYLGKILGGQFFGSRECTPEHEAAIIQCASNPEAAAKAYGLRTGECAICARPLTKGESIDLGIGPICRERMGWA